MSSTNASTRLTLASTLAAARRSVDGAIRCANNIASGLLAELEDASGGTGARGESELIARILGEFLCRSGSLRGGSILAGRFCRLGVGDEEGRMLSRE